MTSLAVAGIVLPILIIIACLPLGLDAFYAPGAFRLTGYVWFVPFRFGRKETREVDKGANWLVKSTKRYFADRHGLQVLLKNGYTILCRLVSRVRVELLMLRFTAAGSDPARGAFPCLRRAGGAQVASGGCGLFPESPCFFRAHPVVPSGLARCGPVFALWLGSPAGSSQTQKGEYEHA